MVIDLARIVQVLESANAASLAPEEGAKYLQLSDWHRARSSNVVCRKPSSCLTKDAAHVARAPGQHVERPSRSPDAPRYVAISCEADATFISRRPW